jgi:hypothetical protein
LKRTLLTVTPLAHDAPVGGPERLDLVVQVLERHDDRAVGLTSGWPPSPLSFPAVGIGVLRSATVGGGAHQLQVTGAEVVQLGVAVTVERAAVVLSQTVQFLSRLTVCRHGGSSWAQVCPSSAERLTNTVGTTRLGSSGMD